MRLLPSVVLRAFLFFILKTFGSCSPSTRIFFQAGVWEVSYLRSDSCSLSAKSALFNVFQLFACGCSFLGFGVSTLSRAQASLTLSGLAAVNKPIQPPQQASPTPTSQSDHSYNPIRPEAQASPTALTRQSDSHKSIRLLTSHFDHLKI